MSCCQCYSFRTGSYSCNRISSTGLAIPGPHLAREPASPRAQGEKSFLRPLLSTVYSLLQETLTYLLLGPHLIREHHKPAYECVTATLTCLLKC